MSTPCPAAPLAPATPAGQLVHFPVAQGGRWLVCYQVPGTRMRHAVEDCPSLEAALRACRQHNGLDDDTGLAAQAHTPMRAGALA